MFVVIVLAAMSGGLLAVVLTYPLGLADVVMVAPWGASVSALLAVVYIALRASLDSTQRGRARAPQADTYKPHDAPADL